MDTLFTPRIVIEVAITSPRVGDGGDIQVAGCVVATLATIGGAGLPPIVALASTSTTSKTSAAKVTGAAHAAPL